jgi:hypothetical protein
MRQEHDNPTAGLPSLAELLERYVSGRAGRFRDGEPVPGPGSEVVPHDAVPVQAVDPRLAWDEAVAALALVAAPGSLPPPCSAPEWKALVAAQEPALDLAFCAGNFPQMVRNLSLLLQEFATGRAAPAAPVRAALPSAGLIEWAERCGEKSAPQALLAAGMLRLAREFERAGDLLRRRGAAVPAEWRAAWRNEEAALAWHAGRREQAADLWRTGPAAPGHVPTLFNLGMAALFLGRPAEARAPLSQAVSQLPEDNSWHHLARLYLTLAEMRS